MRRRPVSRTLFLLVVLILTVLGAQNCVAQGASQLQTSFNTYNQNSLHEKLFMHTDKEFYLAGEILWFKIYAVDGTQHKPLGLSKVAYVELLDNTNNAVLQLKISLKDGTGSGSVYLPPSIGNGHYLLRAYTSWMKNFDAADFFQKQITIVNTLKSPEVAVKVDQPAYNVQFYPEGGYMVDGIASRVAVKVINGDGKGVDYTGSIINQKGDTVVYFQSLKMGMGSFLFTPAAATIYKAVLKINNKTITQALPPVNQHGFVMRAIDKGDTWDVTVEGKSIPAGDVYLLVHNRQQVKIAQQAALANGAAHFTFNKNRLDAGISYITLFDSKQQPLCERLIFTRPDKPLLIEARADAGTYTTRQKVTVSVNTKNSSGPGIAANASLSVYKTDGLQQPNATGIAAYLWLNADLNGLIENADYYLANTTDEANEALNNLLLTQGWRRFDWDKVAGGKPAAFKFLPEYNGHIITGKLTDAATGQPVKNTVTYLGVPGKRAQLFTATSDSTGQLLFNTHDFYGLNEIVVQNNILRDSTNRIEILSPFADQYTADALPAFNLDADMEAPLQAHSLNMQVQNVYAGNTMRQFIKPLIDSSVFCGGFDKTYFLDNYTRFTTMEEVLREYVEKLNVIKQGDKLTIKLYNDDGFLNNEPLVMLDGIPIFDNSRIFSVDPLKVNKLEVLNARYFYGPAIIDGILNFTTYKGNLNGFELDPRALVVDYEGLQLQRQFNSPAYDTEQQRASRLPDFRNTLFWVPNVNISQQGRAMVNFYTGDQPGKYIGIIQGLSDTGEAGSNYFYFEVKKP